MKERLGQWSFSELGLEQKLLVVGWSSCCGQQLFPPDSLAINVIILHLKEGECKKYLFNGIVMRMCFFV